MKFNTMHQTVRRKKKVSSMERGIKQKKITK
jgi:hypothetical protein